MMKKTIIVILIIFFFSAFISYIIVERKNTTKMVRYNNMNPYFIETIKGEIVSKDPYAGIYWISDKPPKQLVFKSTKFSNKERKIVYILKE